LRETPIGLIRVAFVLACVAWGAVPALPQMVLTLTATTADAGDVRIDILRWSTDAERAQLLAAWTQPGAIGRGGRGRSAAEDDQFVAGNDPVPGGRAGRGGRGGRREAVEAPPQTPEASLLAALNNAPIVGHLWSSAEVAGYLLHYAVKLAEHDGSQRILLITDRRLGAWTNAWKRPSAPATNYEFSLIELRLSPKGRGEGKTSLTGKVAADAAAKTLVLDGYAAQPVALKDVKPRS